MADIGVDERAGQTVLDETVFEFADAEPFARHPENVLHGAGEAFDHRDAGSAEGRGEPDAASGQLLHALYQRGICLDTAAPEFTFGFTSDAELLTTRVAVFDVDASTGQ